MWDFNLISEEIKEWIEGFKVEGIHFIKRKDERPPPELRFTVGPVAKMEKYESVQKWFNTCLFDLVSICSRIKF